MDQPEPPATRSAKRTITDDDVFRADEALTQTQGHRSHAATLLKISMERLASVIDSRPYMKAKWTRSKPVVPGGAADEIHRDEPINILSPTHLGLAAAIEKQDNLLTSGWGKLGFNTQQMDFLQTLQTSYSTNLKGTLDLTYGGMVHAYTKLLFLFEDLIVKIRHIDEHPSEYTRIATTEFGENEIKGPHEYRCELYDRLIHVSSELRKVNSDATKANWVRAQIEKLKVEDGKDGKRKKAGWSPRKVGPVVDVPSESAPE